jgi:hypothetical protein
VKSPIIKSTATAEIPMVAAEVVVFVTALVTACGTGMPVQARAVAAMRPVARRTTPGRQRRQRNAY